MIELKQNTDFSLVPNVEINTLQLFGFDCLFKVLGFDKKNDYVPQIDKNYIFDPVTTKSSSPGIVAASPSSRFTLPKLFV